MKSKVLSMAFFFVLILTNMGSAATGPTDTLRPVLTDVTAVLSDESLKGDEHTEERRAKIMEHVKKGFDFREMSQRVLGRTWRTIDEAERVHFTELMTKLLENVYIGKLEGYSGQTVEYAGERVKDDRAQVTTFIENNGVKIPVHYIMKKNEQSWMVYDINIEGVSLVRNYQEQFKAILRKEKYAGLVRTLEEKNKSFLTPEPKSQND